MFSSDLDEQFGRVFSGGYHCGIYMKANSNGEAETRQEKSKG